MEVNSLYFSRLLVAAVFLAILGPPALADGDGGYTIPQAPSGQSPIWVGFTAVSNYIGTSGGVPVPVMDGNNIRLSIGLVRSSCVYAMDAGQTNGQIPSRKEFFIGALAPGEYTFTLSVSWKKRGCEGEPAPDGTQALTHKFRVIASGHGSDGQTGTATATSTIEKLPVLEDKSSGSATAIITSSAQIKPGQEMPGVIAIGPPTSSQSGQYPVPPGAPPGDSGGDSVNDPSKGDYQSPPDCPECSDDELPAVAGPVPLMMWKAWIMPQNSGKEFADCNDEGCGDAQKVTVTQNSGGGAEINSGGIVATTKEKIGSDGNTLVLSGMQINVTPSSAAEKAMQATGAQTLGAVSIQGSEKPVYIVETRIEGRIFGLIPIELDAKTKIDAQTAEVIEIEKPWWSFLVG